ncbi:MAG: hydantoinase/oxoprolinase family protein [Candidatus Thorarchaeota archaeon]|nr:MAG: hydantoinase/oxoprolinase family protein [Candidatus Thorarchaeota archaeon]
MNIIGVDVGGTFTDVILTDMKTGRHYIHKLPSTPGNQEVAVIDGIQQLHEKYKLAPEDIALVVHGTTVATNAMLERKGARVVLLTTKGLEDVLEIGRQQREDIYALVASRPEPLVEREDRIGVAERLDSEGCPIIELSQEALSDAIDHAIARNPESIAISLLFSYRNPIHERAIFKELEKRTDAYVVSSSDVLPEFREFERTSTTVLEAYLGPLVVGYLERLDVSLRRLIPSSKLTVMQSNGGTMLASEARGRAIGLAISGLAGGVIGGWQIAKQCGVQQAITLDMGGTSCDISAIIGDIIVKPDNEVAGHPLRMPSTDVKTIGAGGGSIAWVDDAGILHVGPQSAGAVPGPSSYGKGGTEATVTDANLVLGRLNPDYFLGGDVDLDLGLERESVSKIASLLNMSIEDAARGIIRISTANMVQAIREVTVERGSDPRQFVLVPFGGAGATQAVDIADLLNIDIILVPPHPGITSALGLVCTNLRVDLMRTILTSAIVDNEESLLRTLKELSVEAKKRLTNQGVSESEVQVVWTVDMRYSGQSHELSISLTHETQDLTTSSIKLFESLHEGSFGYNLDGRNVEWVTARVVAQSSSNEYKPYRHPVNENSLPISERTVLLSDGKVTTANVYRRESLGIGQKIVGPSIIEQIDTTTYISPGWIAEQRADGTLWMRREER